MGYFKSSEQLQEVLGDFFQKLSQHPEVGPKLLAAKVIVKFSYREPDLTITINCSGPQAQITFNDAETKPEVEMGMKADTAHKFWFGKVNLVAALTRREITAKGPIPKILKLLPVIKPAYEIYPKFLEEKGLAEELKL